MTENSRKMVAGLSRGSTMGGDGVYESTTTAPPELPAVATSQPKRISDNYNDCNAIVAIDTDIDDQRRISKANVGSNGNDVADDIPRKNEVHVLRDPPTVLHGARLNFSLLGLTISLFLSALETTIVATSLLKIGEAFDSPTSTPGGNTDNPSQDTFAGDGSGNRGGAYDQAGWIVVSYMLTYTAFLVVYAKLSDILGKKNMMLLGLGLFVVFSMACGWSTGLTELIVFRAFQGLGASGIYSMVTVIVPTIVPVRKVGIYMAAISSCMLLSSILGPVIGGVITDGGQWRWVFWLNGPTGLLAFVILLYALPVESASISSTSPTVPSTGEPNIPALVPTSNLPSHGLRRLLPRLSLSTHFHRHALTRIDFSGTFLLLAFSLLLVFALQQAGPYPPHHPWSSPTILSTLLCSILSLALLIIWLELILGDNRGHHHRLRKVSRYLPGPQCEPIFPLRLVKERVQGCLFAVGFLTGFPFMAATFTLPQRFQTVNLASATQAGVRLFPLLLSSALATGVVGAVVGRIGKAAATASGDGSGDSNINSTITHTSTANDKAEEGEGYMQHNKMGEKKTKQKNHPRKPASTKILYHLLLLGTLFQFLGTLLLGTAISPKWLHIPPQTYVFESLLGIGVGLTLTTLIIFVRVEVIEKDLAVAMGAITQVRTLGGCIALAVCSALLQGSVEKKLRAGGMLTGEEIRGVLKGGIGYMKVMWGGDSSGEDERKFELVRRTYAEGYALQMKVMVGFAGLALVAAVGAWRRQWKVFDGESVGMGGVGVEDKGEKAK